MLACAASLHVTVAPLEIGPLKFPGLNWRGILPVFPGSICLSQAPAVVQPQPGRTSVISSMALPVLVKMKSCWGLSVGLTLPKLKLVSANWMCAPFVVAAGAFVGGVAAGGAAAPKRAGEAASCARVTVKTPKLNSSFMAGPNLAQSLPSRIKNFTPTGSIQGNRP